MPADPHSKLHQIIDARQDRLIKFRRRLHASPEPSGHEQHTTAVVADALREAGLDPRVMDERRGVVVDLDIAGPGRSYVAARAELDAVAVNDDKQVPYASTRPGVCHACGHDVHTTMLLAAAQAIQDCRHELARDGYRHNLRFIFQPAEETATGAREVIEQGGLENVQAILALHVEPNLEPGRIALRAGPMTAACKTFRISVRGRSGHSARPHEAIDPIPAATNIVSLFYQLAPRSIDSRYPLALTVGSITSGSAYNAIPDTAQILGTLRTTRPQDTDAVQKRMEQIVRGVEEATGCSIHMEFTHWCPATDNDAAVTRAIADVGQRLLGPGSVQWLEVPSLGGEDFAFYQESIPGAFVRLGAAVADVRHRRPLHSSLFDIDERALPIGAKLIATAALELAATFNGSPANELAPARQATTSRP
jgi:amidohydrolase